MSNIFLYAINIMMSAADTRELVVPGGRKIGIGRYTDSYISKIFVCHQRIMMSAAETILDDTK